MLPGISIFMKDELPNQLQSLQPLPTCIINLDDSDGPGTHWTAYYHNSNMGDMSYYFDSYGFPPPEPLKDLVYQNRQIQALGSPVCGYYCIDFIRHITKDPSMESMYNYCYQWSTDYVANDDMLMKKFI